MNQSKLIDSYNDQTRIKFNKDLFVGENPPTFSVGFTSSIYDTVKGRFIKTDTEKRSNFDDLISRTYSTIMNLYFNK